MKLTAHQYFFRSPIARLQAAPHKRQWMDDTDVHFAYRCLPLVIANSHGWEVLCPCDVTARWDGGSGINGVVVATPETYAASSHFGGGILTFLVPYLFRTDPGINLMVQGPMNRPKDGIQALSAVVETDWAVAPFTMNWKFTRPDHLIKFEKDEPYCHVFPVARNLETVEPKLVSILEDKELSDKFIAWGDSRCKFKGHHGWQKHYHLGKDVVTDEYIAPDDHQQKLRLAEFT